MSAQPATPAAPERAPHVTMSGIVRTFGSFTALDAVDFDVRPGEIHGLLGENGAGKSTLMNVLGGMLPPDRGTIALDGEPVRIGGPQDAVRLGIGMVHQHFMLVPTLTVAESMILGHRGGLLLRKRQLEAVARRLEQLDARYGIGVSPRARIWQLSVGEQQRVEIMRALYHDARVLVLDEPTATLTPLESEQLFPKLRAMADAGAAIVLISHHLQEVLDWADRITILRRGVRVGEVRPAETTKQRLAQLMVGREVDLSGPQKRLTDEAVPAPEHGEPVLAGAPARREPVLRLAGVGADSDRGTPALRDVELAVAPGEILAIAGVEGNGQTELEEVVFGLRRPTAGVVELSGRDLARATPRERLDAGMALVPSDRYRRGMVRELSIAENLVIDRIERPPYGTSLTIRRKAIAAGGQALIDRYAIRCSGPDQPAGSLSGGNAQRVVLARALSHERLACLIAAQPTRGLDVGAMAFVWEQLDAARRRGVAILLISTDLDEVLAVADRCAVLYRGRVVAEWPRAELDREAIGLAMGGAADDGARDAGRSPAGPEGSR